MEAGDENPVRLVGALRARVKIPPLRDHSPEPKPGFG